METILKWWLLVCLTVIGIFLAYSYDVHIMLLQSDITYLSFVILSLFGLSSLMVGYKGFMSNKGHPVAYEKEWFLSEVVVTLGMIGTVIGFIFMLSTLFINLDIEDLSTLQASLGTMAQGMGTALWTTLVGLICSVLLKCQLMLVEGR